MKRLCKVCKVTKEYRYLCTREGTYKKVYVDQEHGIWNGKVCYACHKARIIEKCNFKGPEEKNCPVCHIRFLQSRVQQIYCTPVCKMKMVEQRRSKRSE